MDNQDHDTTLQRLLDSYDIAPPDPALIDRIVALTHSHRIPANSNQSWMQNAALIAATAVVGFWFGSLTPLQDTATTSASGGLSLESVILGPQSVSEVML